MDLLLTNLQYVLLRLAVTAPLVSMLMIRIGYYGAVFAVAQVSFAYDLFIFHLYFDQPYPELISIITADLYYTARVLAAWGVIYWIWGQVNNYWVAVFLGSELTFIVDYYIFYTVY